MEKSTSQNALYLTIVALGRGKRTPEIVAFFRYRAFSTAS